MYVELHSHSHFSLLDGVPSPEQLVQRAADYDMPALALTDHDALYGAARFAQAAARAGIKPIFGAELTLVDGGGHLTLLAESDAGYSNLCRLITLARRDQEKGFAALPWRVLTEHRQGIIALSGCRRSEIARALLERDMDKARRVVERYVAIFGRENFFLEMQRHDEHGDRRLNMGLDALARRYDLRAVATGNVHYLDSPDAPIHDVLTCIRHRARLHEANGLLRPNARYYFRSPQEMHTLFAQWPDALQATLDIAARCNARLPTGPQTFPRLPELGQQSSLAYLRYLCEHGLVHKCSGRPGLDKYRSTLEHELRIIAGQGLADYFLVVWDVMRYARSEGTRSVCQGRGSAANSLVAYLLDITPIDPLAAGLVFERFLSPERATAPDIDIDFAADWRREKVIQYVYRRFGHDRAAMACNIVTFGAKQAIRDVGMALGFDEQMLDRVSDNIEGHSAADLPHSERLRAAFGKQVDSPRWQQLLTLAAAIDSFPRHLSIHSGGMVISGPPLIDSIPVEPARMEDRVVTQWDKDSLELAGWVKLDMLGLRMLSAIADACDIIAGQTGKLIDLSALSLEDPKVYAMIRRGETIGCFQIESAAQASLIPDFQPRRFADLPVQIALIRPGPIQANMVHPYLRRRRGVEPARYLHPLLRSALEETYGVILFQEDVIKVARDLAGFTPGEGELLRRALGHKRAGEQIESFRDKFLSGAQARGVSTKIAGQVFEQLKAFGGYSFSKAHAAAFAVITYWSAWLRCYHPVAFYAGLLRNQPMGFYPARTVVDDARRMGVSILPVDLRFSQASVAVEGDAIRLGLSYVHGFGSEQIEAVETERQRGHFESLADLVRRTKLDRPHVEALALAGALDHLGERRQLLWDLAEAYHLARRPATCPRPVGSGVASSERGPRGLPLEIPDEKVSLPPMDRNTRIVTAYAATGVSLEGHLTTLRRDAFTRAGARPIGDLRRLKPGQAVTVGGILTVGQRPPTAKGYSFFGVEDPDGLVEVVVPPDVYERCREALRGPFVVVEGTLQKIRGAISIRAKNVTRV